MSEISTDSAAPTTTASIAEAAFDQLDASDGATEPVAETPAPETPAPDLGAAPVMETPGVVKPAEQELSPAAKFLLEQGHKATKDDGRPNWMPIKSIEGMLERYVAKHRTEWDTQRTTLESTAKDLQGRFSQIEPILAMLDQGPEKFLEAAGQHDPRYREFLTAKSAPAAPEVPANFPDPDFPLPNGDKTYTVKGLKENVFPWMLEQARAIAKSEAQAVLKPLTEREKAAQERQQLTQAETQLRERTQQVIADAQTWPGFKEHEAEILTVLRADSEKARSENRRPTLSLDAAYRQVVLPKFTEDDTARRARILKELDAAHKASPSVQRSSEGTPKAVGPQTTQSIAARNLDRLERGA